MSQLYRKRRKSSHLDGVKAPGFGRSKRIYIVNIDPFATPEPRELSRRPNGNFSAARGIFFRLIFLSNFFLFTSVFSMEISPAEAELIGRGIFFNECSGRKDRLVWWNQGENFASVGIGHFIWYPRGAKDPFEETFPALLAFFKEKEVELPGWLRSQEGCPWRTKEEFALQGGKKKRELEDVLSLTLPLQAEFIAKRFEGALQKILVHVREEKKAQVLAQIQQLEKSLQGKFALIDYLNFKGDGTLETERYCGKGWGLMQVLEEMPLDAHNPVEAFAKTAKSLLKARVKNAPFIRNEERWLKGWLVRVDRYLNP
jgi:hypothetical protein